MHILLITVTIYIPWAHSLKEKRSELKSLINKLRNTFNASVCETDHQQLHQKTTISVAAIAFSASQADQMKESILAYISKTTQGEIIQENMELL